MSFESPTVMRWSLWSAKFSKTRLRYSWQDLVVRSGTCRIRSPHREQRFGIFIFRGPPLRNCGATELLRTLSDTTQRDCQTHHLRFIEVSSVCPSYNKPSEATNSLNTKQIRNGLSQRLKKA